MTQHIADEYINTWERGEVRLLTQLQTNYDSRRIII